MRETDSGYRSLTGLASARFVRHSLCASASIHEVILNPLCTSGLNLANPLRVLLAPLALRGNHCVCPASIFAGYPPQGVPSVNVLRPHPGDHSLSQLPTKMLWVPHTFY